MCWSLWQVAPLARALSGIPDEYGRHARGHITDAMLAILASSGAASVSAMFHAGGVQAVTACAEYEEGLYDCELGELIVNMTLENLEWLHCLVAILVRRTYTLGCPHWSRRSPFVTPCTCACWLHFACCVAGEARHSLGLVGRRVQHGGHVVTPVVLRLPSSGEPRPAPCTFSRRATADRAV